MLLSDFPREIIEQFTDLLSLNDKISCSLVCKSWKKLFQDSLHSDLVVDRRLLEDILNLPQDHQPSFPETRLLVRYLEIHYYTIAADEDLYLLQQTFPNIKYLHFESYHAIPDNFGAIADWNIWGSLTELHFCFCDRPACIENKLFKIILCLPLLRRLRFFNRYKENIQASFSLDDFETIHSHLKHLTHMELSSNLLTLSETDIERMTKVSPATKMRSLDISAEYADHRWLCYFARKYPNLRTLDFFTSDIQDGIDEHRSNTISLFQQVPLPFQHLTKLNFEYRDLVGNAYLLFWDIIHFPNVPLKHLSVHVKLPHGADSPNNSCDIPKHITEVCLQKFSKTIEFLYLDCPNTYSTGNNFTDRNGAFYNLVDLHINTSTSCEMDVLLCAAPRLIAIELVNSDIKLKGELYNSNRFGLQAFKIRKTKITSDVLRFLSFHCRSLTVLTLESSSIHGSFTTPGCQFIDMTYICLDKLYIEDTKFIIQDNNRCPENLDITLVTRQIDDILPKQDDDSNLLPVDFGGPSVKAHNDWFYTDYFDEEVLEISSEDISYIEEFVSNYEENIKNTKTGVDSKKRKEEYDSWYKSCVFGYTKVEFGYVSDFNINYALNTGGIFSFWR